MISTLQFISKQAVTITSGIPIYKFPTADLSCQTKGFSCEGTLRRDDRGRIGEAAKSRSLVET